MKIAGAPTIPVSQGVESLRGRTDPEAVRAAAREMESLFAYEMVKAMRAAGGAAAEGGFGGEVYGTLFDMELAKVLASRGLGLQEILLKGLGRAEYSRNTKENPESTATAAPPAAAQAPASPPAAAPFAAATPPSLPSPASPPPASAPASPPAPETAVSGPHTHDPLDDADTSAGEGAFPIREGGRISSAFGYRKDPFTGSSKFHHGMDIAAPEGTAVYPAKRGEVTFSGYQKGYGNVVVVDHGDGFVTKYAHNRANRVAPGDRVDTDTVLAEVGSTGRSTGPHLHFEVRYEGKKIPPQAVFAGIPKGGG